MTQGISSTGSFPPETSLAAVLNAASPSVLATNAFADPDAGYPKGLRLAAAADDNTSGRFSLVSGLTLAGNAVSAATSAIAHIREALEDINRNAAILRDESATDDEKAVSRLEIENQIDGLEQLIDDAGAAGINLLDTTGSDGIAIDLNSGALSVLGATPRQNVTGRDTRFDYSPNRLAFQNIDLKAALDDLKGLKLETYPGTEANLGTRESFSTITRFQSTLGQAENSLKSFKSSLNSTTLERVTVSLTENNPDPAIHGREDARQIASRLAQQLHNDSYNVAAGPVARFFSLFA